MDGFNNQWTVIESIRKMVINEKGERVQEKVGYTFRCGCGHSTDYMFVHFPDPHNVAIAARSFHNCQTA